MIFKRIVNHSIVILGVYILTCCVETGKPTKEKELICFAEKAGSRGWMKLKMYSDSSYTYSSGEKGDVVYGRFEQNNCIINLYPTNKYSGKIDTILIVDEKILFLNRNTSLNVITSQIKIDNDKKSKLVLLQGKWFKKGDENDAIRIFGNKAFFNKKTNRNSNTGRSTSLRSRMFVSVLKSESALVADTLVLKAKNTKNEKIEYSVISLDEGTLILNDNTSNNTLEYLKEK